MSEIAFRILISLSLLCLMGWLGYHAFLFMQRPLQTEAVFEYSVSRSIPATGLVNGVAIRSEQVLEGGSSGIESYLYEDGSRVTVNQPVVEFYSSAVDDRNVKRLREIDKELAMLREAQDSSVNNFSNTDLLLRDLRDGLSELTVMSGAGTYSGVEDAKFNLTSLLNRRQVAIGKTENFAERVTALEVERDRLSQTTSTEAVVTVQTPRSGYFSKSVDRYVSTLSPSNFSQYTIEDYLRLIGEEDGGKVSGYVGKLATSEYWYFAVSAERYDVDWVKEGQKVTLNFDRLDTPIPAQVDQVLTRNDSGDAILLFRSNIMTGDVINLRHAEASIHFYTYTGLRISSNSVHFLEDEETGEILRGVYVLENKVVTFKTVDLIYEEAGFLLSGDGARPSEKYRNVSLFDQVITKGNDLYHGKVVD